MATKVSFKWSQIMDSYHPDFSITATFSGWAEIMDLNANEIEIRACFVQWDGMLAKEPVSVVRGRVGSEQNHFIGKCREVARNAYYKERMKEAARNTQDRIDEARKDVAEFPPERPDLTKPIMRQELSEI